MLLVIFDKWFNANEKSIEVVDIRFTPENNATGAVLMIIYKVKAGEKINNRAKGEEY